ncbi:MAG TPA: tripartite tricarboxylate transporter substrate binding protein [Burkholderiaceae bacterium]|nr:tripartite tricarboxylate transporter substrate binding protein [Burkholderiaceae bacterium]
MNTRRKLLAAAGLALVTTASSAQALPDGKQMRIVVPYSAGGTSDILGRKLAQELGARLGRTIVVENRAGAGGSIGTESVVHADADGTTLLLHSGAISTEPALKRKLPYDVTRDLAAVTTVVIGPFAVLVSPGVEAKSIPELVAYAKANPGKLNFGTPGIGTSVHLASEQFQVAAGIKMTHVPYKGSGPALTAAMGNEVQLLIDPLVTAKRYAEDGRLRALAVTTGERSPLWPGMPTVAEGGVANYDTGVWYGLYVPARTPRATVEQLNAEAVKVLKSPDFVAWLHEQGLDPVADTPEQSANWLKSQIETWKRVAAAAGIEAE